MDNLPLYVSVVFVITTFITVFLFWKTTGRSRLLLLISLAWLALQAIIASTGFYTVTDSLPPRLLLALIPGIIFTIIVFSNKNGRQWLDTMELNHLTLIHLVRIPVEFILLWLSIYHFIPEIMTFEGRNFDILSGISAALIWYFGFYKNRLNKSVLLFWNLICLGLLINIVTIAILSAPYPFQKLGIDQPNIAVFYFPFIWLPAYVVPVVLFSHFAAIRKLIIGREEKLAIMHG